MEWNNSGDPARCEKARPESLRLTVFYLFHVFRSFIPLRNPIGFGAADFVELFVAAIVLALVLARARIVALAQCFAPHRGWCMLSCAVLPVALRLALLPNAPAPTPSAADDTSYLLLADTLRHFRLANPTPVLHQFFETNFVLQQPTYSSIFPPGQGIALALGWILFGHPWAGVLLSEAGFCALCYWMLRGWVKPEWALAGGVLAALEFGPLNYWMNSYWGGAVSGMAGCLVFGALPRLREHGRTRDAVLLGAGLGVQLITRPYECVFLVLMAAAFLLPRWRLAGAAALATIPFVALTLAHNKAVTGNWTTLPYLLSRDQYGVPATFTFQSDPVPRRELTQEQQDDYRAQTQVHDREAAQSLPQRLAERFRYMRFFFFPALYVALPLAWRRWRILAVIALFCLGAAFYPYFHPHYFAALACLFVLLSVAALERCGADFSLQRRLQPPSLERGLKSPLQAQACSTMIMALTAAHFIFWYGLHLTGNQEAFAPYESWDFVNHGDPEGRIAIGNQLAQAPGRQLVFVRYGPAHPLREWIYNAANIDQARVIWALDLGDAENQQLRARYPDRTVWLAEPDARPPRIVRLPDVLLFR